MAPIHQVSKPTRRGPGQAQTAFSGEAAGQVTPGIAAAQTAATTIPTAGVPIWVSGWFLCSRIEGLFNKAVKDSFVNSRID